jgi:hypothetical protein
MDTISAAEAARRLRTNIPRVKRALGQIGSVSAGASGRVQITPEEMDRLSELIRPVPVVDGLSRTEVLVLAALSRSPRGLASVRAVARRAGVSPTAAGHALTNLIAEGLARSSREWIAAGRAMEVEILHAVVDAPRWAGIAPCLGQVELATPAVGHEKRVPKRLRHLFWNTADAQLDVTTSASYIAQRLITTGDAEGLAWGAGSLPASAWRRAAKTRGLHPADQALALNLAKAAAR